MPNPFRAINFLRTIKSFKRRKKEGEVGVFTFLQNICEAFPDLSSIGLLLFQEGWGLFQGEYIFFLGSCDLFKRVERYIQES